MLLASHFTDRRCALAARFASIGVWLLVGTILVVGWGCRQSPESPSSMSLEDSVPDSVRVDSIQTVLGQFEAARQPASADSAALRRWADSLQKKGNALRSKAPARARGYLRQALHVRRALSDSFQIAETLEDIGFTYRYQSRYKEAIRRFRQSLNIHRRLDAPVHVANALNNVGIIRDDQGQYEEALARFQEALQIKREVGLRKALPRTLNSIGIIRWRQGEYEKAAARFRESLQIYREIEARKSVAAILNNIGVIRRDQGELETALARFREALQIKREINDREGIARTLNNVGSIYGKRGRQEAALSRYREALRMEREIGDRKGITENLSDIGTVYLQAGRLRPAIDTLQRAVSLAETLRLNATSPEARRSMLSTQISAYRSLTLAHVRVGRPDSALRSLERARARLLADRLAGAVQDDTTFSVPLPSTLRRTLGPNEAAILYAKTGSRPPLLALAVTRDTTVARLLPTASFRRAVHREHETKLERLRREEGPLTAALRPTRPSTAQALPILAETIRLYRYHLVRDGVPSIQHNLAQRLYGLLIAPIEDALGARSTLTVVPSGALGYLPFETLRDPAGRYLVQEKQVRYAQSLTVLRQLQGRTYSSNRRPLLALGGAAYESDRSVEEGPLLASARDGSTRVETEARVSTLLRSAERRIEQGKSPRRAYSQLGYTRWRALPGTKLEVRKLARALGDGTTLLTGTSASEERVRQMSASGRLARYRWVHFATHGLAVPEAPELSALVLSQVGASDSLAARDGYLTMREIANLEMQADVAVLSACRTGLGRIVAGEGVVSLSHAFLRAGANATLVSQWRVPDWSTQQFMTSVYRRAQAEGTSFAEAVTQIKRDFITGKFGKRNTDPLRWAPFVYYGRE